MRLLSSGHWQGFVSRHYLHPRCGRIETLTVPCETGATVIGVHFAEKRSGTVKTAPQAKRRTRRTLKTAEQ